MTKFVATLRTQGTKYFRPTAAPRQPKARPHSPRQAAMLLARRPEKLKPDEQQLLFKLNECCSEIPILLELTQGFAHVFRAKKEDGLQNWLAGAYRAGLPEISRFCDGLLRDATAVTALEQWSSRGPDTSTETRQTADVRPRQIQPPPFTRSALRTSCWSASPPTDPLAWRSAVRFGSLRKLANADHAPEHLSPHVQRAANLCLVHALAV